jgi:hypothetical protein
MTAVEFFYEQIIDSIGTNPKIDNLFEQAKEMEKQQMDKVSGDFFNEGASYMHDGKRKYETFEEYYNETYGSKGSDDHIVDTNEMVSSKTEISDEEIEKWAEKYYSYDELRDGEFMGTIIASKIDAWVDAIKWYREQLKCKRSDGHELDDDIPPTTKYFPTSSQTEISDEEIEKELFDLLYDFEYEEIPNSALYKFDYDGCAKALTKWYREQLKKS